MTDEAANTNEAKANEANEAEADEADESDYADEVDEANEANEAHKTIVADDANDAVLYSLTKYSAIFAEVNGYFGITAPDNQHGRRSSCSLRSKYWYQLDNQLEVVVEKGSG